MNIYITKQNEANLRILGPKESMSGLINKLLEGYFQKEIQKGAKETQKIESPRTDKTIFAGVKAIKTSKDAERVIEESMSGNYPLKVKAGKSLPKTKFCKIHGTPLTDQGRCLQKGCKYS